MFDIVLRGTKKIEGVSPQLPSAMTCPLLQKILYAKKEQAYLPSIKRTMLVYISVMVFNPCTSSLASTPV